ncbi:MAG: tryptophan synthase subunit alpha [bacterium]
MNKKLNETFARLRGSGAKALMPFLTCGYPDQQRFVRYVDAFVEAGADVIEIGFPHSDPLADGPVIQVASKQAIDKGFTLKRGFELIAELTARHQVPLVIMCYANLIRRHGYGQFIRHATKAGAAGLIVPDMIIEESRELRRLATQHNMDYINLVTPTTAAKRVAQITRVSSGFVYLVSVSGTTGMRNQVSRNLGATVKAIRETSDIPVCVGFGVSSPQMAARMSRQVDGVIIGSALINLIDGAAGGNGIKRVSGFLSQVRKALGEAR